MGEKTVKDRERYREYRAHVEGELLGPALRNAVLIFILLQTFVFIPADYVLYPENFAFFLGARLALNVVLAVIFFVTAARYPVVSSWVTCVAGGMLFLSMVSVTGGAESGYYVGLILLVIGMGVITPQNGRESISIASVLFAAYALLPLYTPGPTNWQAFSQHCFFLGAACLEACWACTHMERMRFADYKQQRELEEARDELAVLDKAKTRFSANVHHELRTPLTLILAPLDALRSGDLGEFGPRVDQILDTMHANGRRLHKMINNLLDLSKLENHQFSLQRRRMTIEPLISELVTGATGLAQQKGVELSARGIADLPELHGDPDALEKVFVNLLGNALKFSDRGDLVTIEGAHEEDGRIRISVIDTGIGIDSVAIGTIFDRFAQVDGSATRKYEGTGIGLSLAKEMVELHGGTIHAESDGPGLGTKMHVSLPIGEDDELTDEAIIRDDEGAEHSAQALRGTFVSEQATAVDTDLEDSLFEMGRSVNRWADLNDGAVAPEQDEGSEDDVRAELVLAEDNPDMRALLVFLLEKEFRVRAAKNGLEALELVRERRPDLVVSDVMMPEMSGIELCRQIKGAPDMMGVPVVLVTSKAEREMKIEGLELGADDYVTKPFHPRELLARVRSLVRVGSLQKQLARRNSELEETLSDLKQAEVQLVHSERLAAVGELAAGIAHEINNPVNFALNAARAMNSTVQEIRSLMEAASSSECPTGAKAEWWEGRGAERPEAEDLTDTLLELSRIIAEGLIRTHSLVGDLRDFAAPGKSNGQSARVDLEKGLRSTAQLLASSLSDAGATIELDIRDRGRALAGDAGGLNQVFLNLIKNAGDAMLQGGGVVTVTLDSDEHHAVIRVSDTGTGVSDEVREHLFEPFFTTKEAGSGTGLGLSISRQIVTAHGGTLELDESYSPGASFVVRLPFDRDDFEADSVE